MFSTLATLALGAQLALPAEDTAQARREALMRALHGGGYSVLLRHARTDYSVQEPRGTMPAQRSAQRNLSEDGIRDAALIGAVFRKYGISFDEIIASPMFRTVETAELVAGNPQTTMALRAFPSTPEQKALVRSAPKPGTNRLLVTHHFVIEEHVPGVRLGAVGESEAAVVRHEPDGTLRLAGIITLDDWKALASPGSATAAGAPSTGSGHGSPAVHAEPNGNLAVSSRSAPGRLAHAYIAAFNSGDTVAMRTFLTTSMVIDGTRTVDERLLSYLKLFNDYGPLSLERVESMKATQVSLRMQSKRGALTLTVKASDADATRAESVAFVFREHRR